MQLVLLSSIHIHHSPETTSAFHISPHENAFRHPESIKVFHLFNYVIVEGIACMLIIAKGGPGI